MIGNSPKSDIMPARAAGFGAVFVPHAGTWALELADLPDTHDPGILQVERFGELRDISEPEQGRRDRKKNEINRKERKCRSERAHRLVAAPDALFPLPVPLIARRPASGAGEDDGCAGVVGEQRLRRRLARRAGGRSGQSGRGRRRGPDPRPVNRTCAPTRSTSNRALRRLRGPAAAMIASRKSSPVTTGARDPVSATSTTRPPASRRSTCTPSRRSPDLRPWPLVQRHAQGLEVQRAGPGLCLLTDAVRIVDARAGTCAPALRHTSAAALVCPPQCAWKTASMGLPATFEVLTARARDRGVHGRRPSAAPPLVAHKHLAMRRRAQVEAVGGMPAPPRQRVGARDDGLGFVGGWRQRGIRGADRQLAHDHVADIGLEPDVLERAAATRSDLDAQGHGVGPDRCGAGGGAVAAVCRRAEATVAAPDSSSAAACPPHPLTATSSRRQRSVSVWHGRARARTLHAARAMSLIARIDDARERDRRRTSDAARTLTLVHASERPRPSARPSRASIDVGVSARPEPARRPGTRPDTRNPVPGTRIPVCAPVCHFGSRRVPGGRLGRRSTHLSTPTLLVIHPPSPSRDLLLDMAVRLGFAVQVCDTGAEGLVAFRQRPPDTLVASLDVPDMEGLALVTSVRDEAPDLSLVLLTARASVESAVAAIRLGVHDYLREPIDVEKLRALLTDRFDDALRRRVRLFPAERSAGVSFHGMIGRSVPMQKLFRMLRTMAPHVRTALVSGETGTGKELVARALHQLGPRADRRFVVINCSAVVETLFESELFGHVRGAFTGATDAKPGLFELADGGTLFLDEVGELPPGVQAKLLRTIEFGEVHRVGSLEPRKVDVQVIAATNRDLEIECDEGRFRRDLYYRLNVVEHARAAAARSP